MFFYFCLSMVIIDINFILIFILYIFCLKISIGLVVLIIIMGCLVKSFRMMLLVEVDIIILVSFS